MATQAIAEQFKTIYQTLKFGKLSELFSDDFIAHGTHLPAPMNQAQFMGFLHILTEGCSDMNFNPQISDVDDTTFKLTWQLNGTHSGVLKLSVIGLQDFAPTHRSFALPEDTYVVTLEGDKITKITISPVEGGGIQGTLRQVGLI